MSTAQRKLAAVGCRAHTGWAALVVVAGDAAHLDVVARHRIDLTDSAEDLPRAVYHRSRGLPPAEAATRVAAVARIATERAAAELARTVREAEDGGASVRVCAVVVGSLSPETPLESILASHALLHAAEGRLYQEALLDGAEASGSKRSPCRAHRSGTRRAGRPGSRRTSCAVASREYGERSGRPGLRTRSSRRSRR